MKKLIPFTAAVFIFISTKAQYNYVDINSQPVNKQINKVRSDNSGNIIISGAFATTISFGTFTLNNNIHTESRSTVFVAKRLTDETYAWAKAINLVAIGNNYSNFYSDVSDLYVDASGNSYITGRFRGRIVLGPFTLNSTKSGSNYTVDAFTAKLSVNGDFIWAQATGSGNVSTCLGPGDDYGKSVTVDNVGNVYIAGTNQYKVLKTTGSCSSYCPSSITVVKFSPAGAMLWEKNYFNTPGSGTCGGGSPADIATDGTNIYVRGDIYGLVTFGSVTLNTGSNTVNNIFLLKLDAGGAVVWAKSVTNGKNYSYFVGDGLFVDNSDIYFRGIFYSGSILLEGCTLSTTNAVSFLAKWNSSGVCQWARIVDGIPYGMIKNPGGNLVALIRGPGGGCCDFATEIMELSPDDGSTISAIYSTLNTDSVDIYCFSGLSKTPNGFIFSQNVTGTYQFDGLTITSIGAWDFMLLSYTNPPPPVVSRNISSEVSGRTIVFPNPSTNQFTIRNDNNQMLGTIFVYDVNGKMVYKKFIGNTQGIINVKNFASGMYYIKSDELQFTIKFIKP